MPQFDIVTYSVQIMGFVCFIIVMYVAISGTMVEKASTGKKVITKIIK